MASINTDESIIRSIGILTLIIVLEFALTAFSHGRQYRRDTCKERYAATCITKTVIKSVR